MENSRQRSEARIPVTKSVNLEKHFSRVQPSPIQKKIESMRNSMIKSESMPQFRPPVDEKEFLELQKKYKQELKNYE